MSKGFEICELVNAHRVLFDEVARQLSLQGKDAKTSRLITYWLFESLYVKAACSPSAKLSFPPAIDQAWHFAILQTQEYAALCKELKSPLNHSTKTDADSVSEKAKRVQTFFEWYQQLFGRAPPKHDPHWKLEQEVIVVSSPTTKRARTIPFVDSTRIYFKFDSGLTYDCEYVASDNIDILKTVLSIKTDMPKDTFRLVYGNQILAPALTLADYRIPGGASLLVMRNLRAC